MFNTSSDYLQDVRKTSSRCIIRSYQIKIIVFRCYVGLQGALDFIIKLTLHFKVESIYNVVCMVRYDSWIVSVDFKDAFYSIPVKIKHQKFLKFLWDMPCWCHENLLGHQEVVYVGDSFLIWAKFVECTRHNDPTINLLGFLGLIIQP